jgi:hypothetical protein
MSIVSRRHALLSASALAPLAFLAGCGVFSTSTSNGVTTVTVNTAAINTDGSAIIAAATSVLAIPLVSGALGANMVAAMAALAAAKTALASIAATTNGSASASINVTSVQAFVTNLLTGVGQITTLTGQALSSVGATVVQSDLTVAQNYLASINTLVAFVQIAASLATPATASAIKGGPMMTEAEALRIAKTPYVKH